MTGGYEAELIVREDSRGFEKYYDYGDTPEEARDNLNIQLERQGIEATYPQLEKEARRA